MNKIFLMMLLVIAGGCFTSCESLDDSISEDPYGGGKEPLEIGLLSDSPEPSSGYPGDTIVFKAKGLSKWSDPDKGQYDFKFYLGEQDTKIVTATDTTLTVVVPENCSSGMTYIVLQNQVFYGPNFPVLGNVSIDSNFNLSKNGTNDVIYDCLEKYTNTPNYFLVGSFTKIGSYSHTGIGYVDYRGYVADGNTTNFRPKVGIVTSALAELYTSTYINSISAFNDGRMLVSGTFTAYETSNVSEASSLGIKDKVNVNNIMILNKDAQADTLVSYFSELEKSDGTQTPVGMTRLNGGTPQSIVRSFVTSDQQVLVVGNLQQYVTTQYAAQYADNKESFENVSSAFRMSDKGVLDYNYRIGAKFTGAEGGVVSDACIDGQDGVILVGSFTSFDGKKAPGIVRLDKDGNVDEAFMQNVGDGANNKITSIRYNQKLKKMMIVGGFSTFNQQKSNTVAMLNSDGTLDEAFKERDLTGGAANYAQLLNNGKVIVSGSFTSYDGVPRPGFLILDSDGVAEQRFNVPGAFEGQLYKVVETETTIGSYGLLLLGDISKFNSTAVHNVVMLEVDFDN